MAPSIPVSSPCAPEKCASRWEPVNSCVAGLKNDWLCQIRPLRSESPGSDPQQEKGGCQGPAWIVSKVRSSATIRQNSLTDFPIRTEPAGPPPSSPWDLPVEIQIRIFAYSGITDFHPLRLVCKAFYQLLTRNEHEIVRQYLRLRRHGTLPSPIDDDRIYTRNPGDDVVLLSDLFPPSKSARGGHLYTFKYLHGLRRRQMLCSRLCYYLADRILDRFVQTEPAVMKASFPAKRNERNALVKRGIASIWFHLAPLM